VLALSIVAILAPGSCSAILLVWLWDNIHSSSGCWKWEYFTGSGQTI
jgi:hypothetical protein